MNIDATVYVNIDVSGAYFKYANHIVNIAVKSEMISEVDSGVNSEASSGRILGDCCLRVLYR